MHALAPSALVDARSNALRGNEGETPRLVGDAGPRRFDRESNRCVARGDVDVDENARGNGVRD
jgi:hypothetical protein